MQEPVSTKQYTKPADGGKRLIPNIVDEIASHEPNREWAQIPVSSDPKDGWKTVTFQQFANAINRCCHLIIERTGQAAPGTFPTVAYIGPNDARYLVSTPISSQHFKPPLSVDSANGHVRLPRNSQEAQFNLFDKTGCKYIAFPESHKNVCQPLLDARGDMKAIPVMPLDAYMDETAVSHYPFDRTFEEAEWDPMVVLHTSGSTGLPKPIVVRQGMFALADAWMDAPELDGMKPLWSVFVNGAKRHYCTMPLFHAAGIYMSVWFSLYYGKPIALGISDKPLSSDLVVESLKNLDVEAAVLPPAILEDMSLDEEATKALAKLHAVGFGGGNLAQEAGDRLVQAGARIVNVIATTECSIFPLYWNNDPKLWHWFIFNPNLCGIEWRRQKGETDDEDVYEQVYVRRDADPGAHIQGYFYTFPEENEISTKDLYTPHPTLPHHWLHHGRADDIIVFSNGEKLNPVTIEEIVEDHPQVKGVVVVGAMRFQPAMIIEPVAQPKSDKERQDLTESVYATKVQKANEQSVAHGRVDREHIMVATPDKPFPRAGKGTIQRAATVKLYKDDIDALYNKADQASEASAPKLDTASEEALAKSIVEMFQSHVGASKLDPDADFFSAGIDSMQVIKASRLLRASLAVALKRDIPASDLTTRVVYTNPSPHMLARYIMQNLVESEGANKAVNPEAQHQRDMTALWDKYTHNLMSKPLTKRPEASETNQTVLITGTTGMLGSYMLDIMAHSPRVRKIICLNRPDDGGAGKQTTAMQERGLDGSYGGKAEFLQIDASQPNLGLSKDVYARLQQEADRVVLNAWPVNFNMPVSSFEPHIRGVRNWADFAATSKKRVAVVFVSSIGTVNGWKAQGQVPEARFEDMSLAHGGYGASKVVASLVLEDAARVGDFPAAAVRVGQIAGPERDAGVWNRQEWLPSIVASSLYLKALPKDLGGDVDRVDWTPGERIANLVLEVVGVTQPVDKGSISGYYHGANPSATTWATLSRAVLDFYGKERLPETVSFKEWVRRLEKTQEEGTANLAKNPGVKLLDSYRQMAQTERGMGSMVMDMTRTKGQSPTMRRSEAVTPELMKQWCKHWGF
ncbi:Non-canonical non-ribosomal peptide synthetase FUB8 [Apiospora rasikravindrae]|uniref:Non-canonical non-ribosomal peptide synthetase FUB8 n=1 Tax=Apiospora rasikravindrae TaxID=990691 RepID=A0ABR1RPG5_9PEZI